MLRRLRESAHTKVQNALRDVLDERRSADREVLRAELAATREQLTAEVVRVRADLGGELGAARDQLAKALVDLEWRQRRDLYFAAEVRAAAESEAFVLQHMPTVPSFPHPYDTLRFGVGEVAVGGMALEFGVATGATLRIIAEGTPGRPVHGFDVFTGLPEDWRTGFGAGSFAQAQLPEVDGVELVVGLFADTLPAFLTEHPGPVALLHLDADLYSAAVTVFDLVGPRLVEGSVIVFDEYFNYPGWQDGEHKAWSEFVERTAAQFDYLGYTFDHEQLVVRITRAPQR